MKGRGILEYIPFKDTALARSLALKPWWDSWTESELKLLSPEAWLGRGHDLDCSFADTNLEGRWMAQYKNEKYLWAPATAEAEAAVGKLRKARHKCAWSTHNLLFQSC